MLIGSKRASPCRAANRLMRIGWSGGLDHAEVTNTADMLDENTPGSRPCYNNRVSLATQTGKVSSI